MMDAAPSLVLVHGWGFDASFWEPMLAALPEVRAITIELGFRGGEAWSGEVTGEGPLVAVGHSLGFLWLLHERPFNWRNLVAINGFPRFTEGEGFAPAVAAKTLQMMIAGLERSPEKTVADFMAVFGVEPPGEIDGKRLLQGLEWLRDWDMRQALEDEAAPVLALAGRSDPIVPEAMSEASFARLPGVSLEWHDGGHMLPLTDPVWCAERIRKCLEQP